MKDPRLPVNHVGTLSHTTSSAMAHTQSTRRRFLAHTAAVAGGLVGSVACHRLGPSATAPATPLVAAEGPASHSSVNHSSDALSVSSSPTPTSLPVRQLGATHLSVPILGLGGSASPLSRSGAEAEAIAIIERAYAGGIRYFDTAANYGPSEERLGQVLPAVRDQVVIATKTSRRDRDSAWEQLERSLQRLQTDYIDLWQFHSLTYDWDVDTLLDPQQGAIKAALEAKDQGIIRAIGVTGHNNPGIIVQALERYPFDTALIPVNAADKHTSTPFIEHVLPVAQERNTGIIAMKVPAYGRLLKPGVLTGMAEAMGYALSQPQVHCCIVAADTLEQLEENMAAAAAFRPLATATLADIEQRTQAVWQESSFFRNWS